MAKKKRFGMRGNVWQLVGLAVLALITFGVVAYTLVPAKAPEAYVQPLPRASAAPTVTTAAPVRVAVIGDSYSAGTGAGNPSLGWVARLAQNQLWNLTNLARGGTGYSTSVKDNPKACGLDYCPSYSEMIGAAVEAKPTMVIVAGGRNDASVSAASESEAIRAFYTDLRAKLPSVKIVAFNPLWDSTMPPPSIAAMGDSVKAAVESVGGVYLDAGQVLAKAPGLVGSDGVHPNAAGHAAIFEASVRLLQQAGIALK